MSRTLIYAALAALTLSGFPDSAEAAGKPDRTLTRAAKALGAEIPGLEFAATGSWYQFGQAPAPCGKSTRFQRARTIARSDSHRHAQVAAHGGRDCHGSFASL